MALLSVYLLGPFRVTLGGEPVTEFETEKVRALLAYLAVEADRPHQREVLAEMLWPGRPEGAARANLSHTLASLRRAISDYDTTPPFLRISRSRLQFNEEGYSWLDVTEFTSALDECRRLFDNQMGYCDADPCRLRQAIDLYQDNFLASFSLVTAQALKSGRCLPGRGLDDELLTPSGSW